jgi:hypothetical protein
MGADFGDVRTHTDEHAASSADRLGARAFTMGKDVFFARGQFDPHSQSGQGLIAHELAHVVQQRSGRAPAGGLDTPGDPHELEAEAVSRRVMSGESARVGATTSGHAVQCVATPAVGSKPASEAGPRRLPKENPKLALKIPGKKVNDPTDQQETQERYTKAADAHGIRSLHPGRGTSSTLWSAWEKSRRFPVSDEEKKQKQQVCQVDHIIELQVSGADAPDNLRLLEARRNESAGSQLAQNVAQVRDLAGAKPDEVIEFSRIEVEEPPEPDHECLGWELGRRKGIPAPVVAAGHETLPAQVAGLEVTIGYNGKTHNVHPHSRYVVPGFRLRTVTPTGSSFALTGVISDRATIPFQKEPNQLYTFVVSKPGAKLELSAPTSLKIWFPFLSDASLPISLEGGDMRAKGTLRPTLALLRHVEVNLAVERERLTGGVSVPPEKLKQALPVPGLEIPEASLAFSVDHGKFGVSGGFAVRYSTIADGRVRATFSDAGFEALGALVLHIPGIHEAQGQVWVKQGKLGGRADIGASKIKVPGVRDAHLTVLVEDGALHGTGIVHLDVPGVKEGRLDFGVDKSGDYAITGTAALSVPGLKEAALGLTLRNGDIEGAAHVGLNIPGLEQATFDVLYVKGKLTGGGKLGFKKGKLAGTVTVVLSEQHRLSGGGELGYEIAPGLIAFALVQITPEGKTEVSGGLRVPETIDIFARKQVEKDLFRLPTIEIPILAIPLGTHSIGIVATIDARLVARAGVGPGQLQKVKMLGEFDPSSDAAAFSFQASAVLHVPASAELALSIAGGIGVSLAIARAVGGIEAEGAAGLAAEFVAEVDLRYQAGQFSVSGVAELSAQPRLVFRLSAFVRAEADLWVTTIELYRKEWKLKEVEAGAGLKVGVIVPFVYVFGKPFDLRLDQIQFVVPPLDARSLMKELLPH